MFFPQGFESCCFRNNEYMNMDKGIRINSGLTFLGYSYTNMNPTSAFMLLGSKIFLLPFHMMG